MPMADNPRCQTTQASCIGSRAAWFFVILVLASLAVLLMAHGAVALGVTLLVAMAAVALVALERVQGLAGPLFRFDLVRLARKGRHSWLRVAYGAILLFALCFTYAARFSVSSLFDWSPAHGPLLPVPEMAKLAEDFALTLVLAQAAAILLLSPAYLAGAIAEEKERRTLELLFTTHLTDHEIVLGKMLSRMAHLAGVLLTALPVLSLIQLFGGVSAKLLAIQSAVALFTLLSVGGICILCSVLAKSVLGALATSYAVVFALHLGCLCPPCAFVSSPLGYLLAADQKLVWLDEPGLQLATDNSALAMLVPYALVHGGIALVCCILAVVRLRQATLGGPEVPRRVPPRRAASFPPRPPPKQPAPPSLDRLSKRTTVPISDSPLLWKEAYHGDTGLRTEVALKLTCVLFAVVVAIALLGLLAAILRGENFRGFLTFYGHALRLFVCFLLLLLCACVGFRSAGSVSREREQNTLQSLLLLPIDRRDILAAKWLGAIVRMRHIAYFLMAIWAIGLLTGAFHPLAILLMALASGVFVACTASLGLLLSVVCRRTLTANIAMAVFLFVWFLATGILLLLLGPAGLGQDRSDVQEHICGALINPFYAVWRAGFGWPSLDLTLQGHHTGLFERLWAPLPSLLWYSFLAWLCWLLANQAFAPSPRSKPARDECAEQAEARSDRKTQLPGLDSNQE